MEDTAFYHIEMDSKYAYLISEDEHVVLEHSIYNGKLLFMILDFEPKISEIITYFNEDDLMKFKFL